MRGSVADGTCAVCLVSCVVKGGCCTAAGESLSPSCHGLVTRLMHEGRPNLVCLTPPSFLIDVRVLAFAHVLSQLVPQNNLLHLASARGASVSELVSPICLVDFCRLASSIFTS